MILHSMTSSVKEMAIIFWILATVVTTVFARNCTKEEFKCKLVDQCIPLPKWQDGIEDCLDASDEVCLPWQFDCRFGNPRCIGQKMVNDGKIHCYSALDEGCPSHHFVCADRSACIEPEKYQNGKIDCADGSDEPCKPGDYPCSDGVCVSGKKFQDGHLDCADGSDEECTAGQFECACGNTRCIDAEKVDNGENDCTDGSDERGQGNNAIPEECPDGSPPRISRRSLTFGTNMSLCSEPNPCPTELGQVCIVVGGAWRCVCKLGLVRPSGSTRCLPMELLPQYLANPIANCTDYQKDLNIQIGSLKNASSVVVKSNKTQIPKHFPKPAILLSNDVMKEANEPESLFEPETLNVHIKEKRTTQTHQATHKVTTNKVSSVITGGITVIPQQHQISRTTYENKTMVTGTTQLGSDNVGHSNDSIPYDLLFTGDEEFDLLEQEEEQCDPNSNNGTQCKGENVGCVQSLQGFFYCGCASNATLIDGKCVVLMNECQLGVDDCHEAALCMDNYHGYECLCKEGYLDVSPDPISKPGRKCHKLVNECANGGQNDCDPNAKCLDKPFGFTCRCHAEYYDMSSEGPKKPGRKCVKLLDECTTKKSDCAREAKCRDLPIGYTCQCPFGFTDISKDKNKPGRVCAQMNSDDVSEGSICFLVGNKTKCTCAIGYADLKPDVPGTQCSKALDQGSNPCQDYSRHDCDPIAECISEQPGYFQCHCPRGFVDVSDDKRFPGRKCVKVVDECSLGSHNCDTHADCIDTTQGFTCRCRPGYSDASHDTLNNPGRICKPAQRSQCLNIDCAKEAECRESPSGPVCQCVSGYVDISRQHGRMPGRVCRAVVNECALSQHDCSKNAACIDTAEGFTCRCGEGFRDESPDSRTHPGRVCVRAFAPDPPECDVGDPMSCDQHKQEVCLFMNGTYKCRCAAGYSRLPDGRCMVINECADKRLNDCAENAECIDQAEGYSCQCRSGFADVSPAGQSGRICRARVNECSNRERYGVDCSENAICVDREDGYSCQCRPGFADVSASYNRLPGRKCIEAVNECLDENLNDCSKNALCEDTKEGYVCSCRSGYVDVSPNSKSYPGRVCIKPIEKARTSQQLDTEQQLDRCDPKHPKCRENEVCVDRLRRGQHTCECAENAFRYEDGSCRLYSACSRQNECDQNAVCLNVFDSYKCQCRPGFIDISKDPENVPGRICRELVNECATPDNQCSPFARCIDATAGYACQCQDGYVDVSSKYGLPPGRKCASASNECALNTLNTCDENADCIDTPDGYTCQCYAGYVDVSTSANLPPGRVCTVQTTCPKQKTDLMFLIDGSGSIGSYVFKNEVLRFVKEFVDLFEIGPDRTRVGLIQYSDQIRHEFDLNQYQDKTSLLRAISDTQYLTGLTRTGAAIQHMVREGFTERRGARPQSDDISRVAIVLTDGRSQDNVTAPAIAARNLKVNTFAIGVTDHVLASELESIAGSPNRWFYVDRFKDLDTRLRSMIQKVACPSVQQAERINPGPCNPRTQTGCDRSLNELCVQEGAISKCVCPEGFQRHPTTRVCGGTQCNPQLLTSCIYPEECLITPFSNYRCSCPDGYQRDYRSGFCVSVKEVHIAPQADADCHNGGSQCGTNEMCTRDRSGSYGCECLPGYERNPRTSLCSYPGECNPQDQFSCDVRKREHCLLSGNGHYMCQCARNERRHPVTAVCLKNECESGENDCDRSARCIDTDEGYMCACPRGFIDRSPDVINKPGRLCIAEQNECLDGSNRCSANALCTDTEESYICRCKPGYIDNSPNPLSSPGLVCKELVNECLNPNLNDCHRDAICIDTQEAYTCLCKAGFQDMDEFRNPGRSCQKVQQNDRCSAGKNSCDRNARCIQIGDNDYACSCPPEFKDKSPNPLQQPGRLCIPVIPECDNPSLNDCDSPDRAICTDTDESYMCRCRQGYLDISPTPSKPGRLCKQMTDECALGLHDCARDGGICEDTPDSYTCRCAINYLDVSFDRQTRPGRKCKRLVDECATGQNDCSLEAQCTDTEDSYICACPATHNDVSPDVAHRPGRRCLLRVNECTTNRHDCSPNADCIDTPESYQCRCRDDFVDESPERSRRPGRICKPALADECRLGKHDCHANAFCQDLPQGYTCQCKPDFVDDSPHRSTHPGRLCRPRPTPPPDECRIDSLRDCRQEMGEVCRLINGVPKCSCAVDYQRDSAGACTIVNECALPQLNDCHTSAECIDQQRGYTCRCLHGFKDIGPRDKPGRLCKPMVNECEFPHLNDCHHNAQCIDLDEGYECKCHSGYKDKSIGRPGRICKQMIDECANPNLNSCAKNAKCTDEEDGYRCECHSGFFDVSPSPTLKGRACRAIVNECRDPKLNDCDRNAICRDTLDSYECECPPHSRDISPNQGFPGRVCLLFENECETGKHDCDQNAICHDNEQAFTCECPRGYADRSPSKLTRPGRVCVKLVNECVEQRHTCSAQADCRDLEEGYTCQCKDGYIDRSPNIQLQPGRVCGTPEVCPSNHDCSSAAVCEPLGGNKYKCTCIQGYVDQSPSGQTGKICVRNNACRDPTLNNCSKNAICYDELRGYRCECARGYVDKSPNQNEPGRICEAPPPPTPPPRHPCQDPERNDCHPAGTCRATGAQTYTCECLQGYADRSPDLMHKPGRLCVLTQPICLDPTLNDCHPAAICSETSDGDKYTCRCRDGYIDQSPMKSRKPGRICMEQVNECLDRSLNDCDNLAVCEDRPEGYTCRCPVGTKDTSPDPSRPGRRCFQQVNECRNPSLNSCSRFAECIDKEDGYSCKCMQGYHDDEPSNPGTKCTYVINECESPNLNDCDRNADCMDTPGGYECRCRTPYRDEGPRGQPGRICRLNECTDPKLNNCDTNADCHDTDDGYYCSCRTGFYDNSPNPLEPGRICLAFQEESKISHRPLHPFEQAEPPTRRPQQTLGIQCGRGECLIERNEVCIGGVQCGCRPGEGRSSVTGKCQKVDEIPFQVRVVATKEQPLFYSSEYGNSNSAAYVEVVDRFEKDMARTFGGTTYAPRYINTNVNYITHPKTVNSSWPDGLLVKFDVQTTQSKNEPIDACDMWRQMMGSLQRTNNVIGSGSLRVASDTEQLNPCKVDLPPAETCGGQVCDENLGEMCIAGQVCGCPHGQKRASPKDHCRAVESWSVPILVARKGSKNLVYDAKIANPLEPIHKEIVQRFEQGVSQCYPHTDLKSAFVTAEVNDIIEPASMNATWDSGLLFNATMHFRRGAVRVPSDVYYKLIRYVKEQNADELGESELYLSPFQPDPYKACYKNDCHPEGRCIDLSPNSYRCECGPGFRDLDPALPGRKCLPTNGFNECENKEDNECSENARCIDLPHLYKCECLPSYADASPPGAIPGSVCHLDYCSDVNFCPTNTTCKNLEQQAECKCDSGFMDIRKSEKRVALGLDDSLCMHVRDVDECALGLTNCSGVADCIDRAIGYTCKCPDGYIDGNPDEPGRVCGALLCDLCNSHGDCVHNAETNNITCVCTDGWSGEFCQAAPSNASMVLLIILALLFLLLTLCCLLYFCTKCHCFKGRRGLMAAPFGHRNGAWPWSTLEGSSSSESGAEFSQISAGGHEYYPDIGIPRAKLVKGAGASASAEAVNRSMEVARLDEYLDTGVKLGSSEKIVARSAIGAAGALANEGALRIPRAHLSGNGGAAGIHDSFDSQSSSGSEYTIKEEIERRVITDVNVKEIKTTTTTDDQGQTVTTTAEYHHVPNGGRTLIGNSQQQSASSYAADSASSAHYASAAHESSSAMSASASQLHSGSSSAFIGGGVAGGASAAGYAARSGSASAAGAHNSSAAYANHAMRMTDEQERGESVAEFSIGRVAGRRSALDQHHFSENRAMSEFTDEASVYSSESEEIEHEKGDKRVKVSKSHTYEPDALGGTERFRSDVVTTKTSSSVTKQ